LWSSTLSLGQSLDFFRLEFGQKNDMKSSCHC
jgi:hypothetical protein